MGVTAAIIGSAALGAVGSVLGGKKQASAAKDATRAQTQSGREAIDLQRDIYNDQVQRQQPYYQAGTRGLGQVERLLGTGGTGQAPQAAPQNAFAPSGGNVVNIGGGAYQPTTGGTPRAQMGDVFTAGQPQSGPDWQAYLDQYPDVSAYIRSNPRVLREFNGDPLKVAEYHFSTFGRGEGRALPQVQTQPQQPSAPPPPPPPQVPQASTEDSVGPMTQELRQTPGYQFLQDEAKRGIENSFASRGKLLSGSAMSALNDRTIGLADQTYQNSVNNAFNLANLGMGSAAQIQGAGNAFASGATNAFNNIGRAQAQGAYGKADAWNAGMQGVANAAGQGVGAYGAYKGWF